MTQPSKTLPGQLVTPLVLSGGAGTRLWPVSTDQTPKQFLKFGSAHSLIQETLLRCSSAIFDKRPIVVTLEAQRELIEAHVQPLGITADIVLEPLRRDSCAAVLSGALVALSRDKNAIVLVLAADHHIADRAAFAATVETACAAANQGYIVTFGVKPTNPATGYGYVLPGRKVDGTACQIVERFVEKPSLDVAQSYVRDGYLWNSGNFLARADVLVTEAQKLVPDVIGPVQAAWAKSVRSGAVISLDSTSYEAARRISLDFGIMEKTGQVAVLPVSYGWNDIGTWDSVGSVLSQDAAENAVEGNAVVINGRNNLVYADGVLTVVNGLDDIVVIATPGSVLVMRKGQSETVKPMVAELVKTGRISG